MSGRDGDDQRLGVGQADVFGGVHDQAPGDVAGILPSFQHGREVVERRVGVRAADRLDEGGNEVVVGIAALVVDDLAAAGRVLDVPFFERGAFGLRRLPGELQSVQRGAGISARTPGDRGDELVRDLGSHLCRPPAHDDGQFLVREWLELVDLRA
jgi:hypothetical protein